MTRKLPWKRDSESSSSNSARNTKAQSPKLPPARKYENQDVLRTPVSRRHVRRVLDSDPIRSPSTSPPPERPHEEFMIPGPLNDDKFRMVDDEFLHMAQRFTAHLHRAEYDRLKALAKAQNAATISEIERPVVASAVPTARARQRSEAAQNSMKRRKALEAESGDDGDDHKAKEDEQRSPWATGLRGLMEAPRREGRTIIPAANASSSSSRTRAAAGYSSKSSPQQDHRSREKSPSLPPLVSSSKRVKLDLPANPKSTTTQSRNISQHPRTSNSNPQDISSRATELPKGIPRPDSSRTKADNQPPSVYNVDDDLDDDLFGLHERRMSRKKSREQSRRPGTKSEVKDESKTIDLSSIPTFL
ncbi:hypothetical protein N5P37_003513 [Trichoderma harzianum]|uniref:Uncharacterized protein n=1 Tax=Trichoderma harzianum CBS 226.95 TaxID=983964 RepID=A0A2T4AUP2_TRIHA|nr:hypothetical protein M431DRAFT_489560 [Trichoderma harzianum CBS 226.95]KAK0764118.1 hypothetical protein N5P37_003513 [Trichoderma harzianum]PTB60784.1 hypothetical protein M431DRAFT_489560 [Trichoderma harzianum CBS 226.95]